MDLTNATHIDVEAGVRYWEDASVNGVDEDDDRPTIHGASGGMWRVRIRLTNGLIEGWPTGMTASIHYKVCDEGEYWLSNAEGQRIAKWNGYYVPNDFLCHGEKGFGDYIIMDVGSDGIAACWSVPDVDPTGWTVLS